MNCEFAKFVFVCTFELGIFVRFFDSFEAPRMGVSTDSDVLDVRLVDYDSFELGFRRIRRFIAFYLVSRFLVIFRVFDFFIVFYSLNFHSRIDAPRVLLSVSSRHLGRGSVMKSLLACKASAGKTLFCTRLIFAKLRAILLHDLRYTCNPL